MRILHVIDSLDPATGGPPVVMTRLAAAQAALGHEVGLVAFGPLASGRLDAMLSGVPNAALLHFHWVPPVGRLSAISGIGLRRPLKAILASADVVHAHGVWDVLIRAVCNVAYGEGVPYVIAPHGMLDPWSLAQSAAKKRVALLLGYRKLLDRSAFLHALNADEASLFAPLGLRAPVEVIPNGVFIEEIEPLPAPGSFRAEHLELGDAPYVLFLGRLHHKKGLDYLADAFAVAAGQVPDLRLVVAGPDEGAGEAFRRRVLERGVDSRVHVVGPVYGRKKYAALADAACFCLPSRQEGFSIAVLEALACGVPCVLSAACHFPEVQELDAGRVVPCEPRAIASAIIEVLNGGQQMRQQASELVRSRFLWGKIAAVTLDHYARALSARRERPPSNA